MTRELLVLRHGKAEVQAAVPDHRRELKDKGKRQAQRIGVWMQRHDAVPDVIVASSAERALVTAEKAIKAGGHGTGAIRVDARLYEADAFGLFSVLAGFEAAPRRVMLVGHNPSLSVLVERLSPQMPAGFSLKPGMLVRLELPDDWSDLPAGCARLLDCVDPADLPEMFPFPDTSGAELRPRPAYYYTQSAVIPYRVLEGRLQVLVITSSKKNHWVVPKGIHDPGLTAQESAAKEAEEEAGIFGDVDAQPVGQYSQEKWGADCTVTVYPMRVTSMVGDGDWDENHRDRRWVDPHVAARQLKHPRLADLVRDFADGYGAGRG